MVARTTTESLPPFCSKPGGGGGCGFEAVGLNNDCTHLTKLLLNNSIFPISSITKRCLLLEGPIYITNIIFLCFQIIEKGLGDIIIGQIIHWPCEVASLGSRDCDCCSVGRAVLSNDSNSTRYLPTKAGLCFEVPLAL